MAGDEPTMYKPEKINGFDKYDVEDCLRAVTKAAEVKKDPKKLKAVQMLAAQQLDAAQKKRQNVDMEAKTSERLKKVYKGK